MTSILAPNCRTSFGATCGDMVAAASANLKNSQLHESKQSQFDDLDLGDGAFESGVVSNASVPHRRTSACSTNDLNLEAMTSLAYDTDSSQEDSAVDEQNLARRLTARTSASDVELYLRLREISPSSHADASSRDWPVLASAMSISASRTAGAIWRPSPQT